MVEFAKIYDRQEEFENMLIKKCNLFQTDLKSLSKKEKTTFSKELALLLHQEISEFIDAVGNYKHHKTQEDGKDTKEIKEEIADMFIFVLNMALTHNMSAEELLQIVNKKQDKNFERQNSGY